MVVVEQTPLGMLAVLGAVVPPILRVVREIPHPQVLLKVLPAVLLLMPTLQEGAEVQVRLEIRLRAMVMVVMAVTVYQILLLEQQ